jgi:hydroxypyruvate isomerase
LPAAAAGVVAPGDDRRRAADVFVAKLRRAADLCAEHGIHLLIETNNRRDFPNYLLRTMDDVREVLAAADRPNLRAVFDFHHVQINEGDVSRRFVESLDLIDHVQIANPPLRHEPGAGELDFDHLFRVVDRSGYDDWVGAEHFASEGDMARAVQ